jgi:hypothetical protein
MSAAVQAGIELALTWGMTIPVPRTAKQEPTVEWLHWLFLRDGRAISCDVDVRGDGMVTVSVLPLWTADGHIVEAFATPAEAIQRHAQIAKYLHASGWLLADSGTVKPAA